MVFLSGEDPVGERGLAAPSPPPDEESGEPRCDPGKDEIHEGKGFRPDDDRADALLDRVKRTLQIRRA